MTDRALTSTDALIELHKRAEELEKVLLSFDCYVPIISLYEFLFGLMYKGRDLEESKEYMEKLYNVIPLTQGILKRALS